MVLALRYWISQISSSFKNPKLNLHIEDGIKYVKNCMDETYDIIIVDSTDPVGPAEGLFTHDFYKDVYRCLKEDGVMTTQSESPMFNTKVFKELYHCYGKIFNYEKVHPYLAYIPTYPSGMWSFTFCSKNQLHPKNDFDEKKAEKYLKKFDLKYYNKEIHKASFVLPTYVKQLLDAKVELQAIKTL